MKRILSMTCLVFSAVSAQAADVDVLIGDEYMDSASCANLCVQSYKGDCTFAYFRPSRNECRITNYPRPIPSDPDVRIFSADPRGWYSSDQLIAMFRPEAIEKGDYACNASGFGALHLASDGENRRGTYKSSWGDDWQGVIDFVRLPDGTWGGTWAQPGIGRAGELTDISVGDGEVRGNWNVIDGQEGVHPDSGAKLPLNSGTFHCWRS